MPWEAKRWVVFALLMFAASFWALNYRPEGAPVAPPRPPDSDRPTVALTLPGTGQSVDPPPPAPADSRRAAIAPPADEDAGR